ncbi:MAG: hypothetical protein IKF98_00965, partial [Clostridia bacterium]|nr:hypothetical protein [Clostridia bacterium]
MESYALPGTMAFSRRFGRGVFWGLFDVEILICRADARLKGDRSPFNTSSSDLPEIAGDFRAANLQGSLFCSGRQA